MKLLLIIISIFYFIVHSNGQTPNVEYNLFIKKADSLFKLKDYKNSALSYSSAFKTFGNKGFAEDRYNAARAWSLANTTDSAFDCLQRIVKKRMFNDYDRLVREKAFENLHDDKRWKPFLDSLYAIKDIIIASAPRPEPISFNIKIISNNKFICSGSIRIMKSFIFLLSQSKK